MTSEIRVLPQLNNLNNSNSENLENIANGLESSIASPIITERLNRRGVLGEGAYGKVFDCQVHNGKSFAVKSHNIDGRIDFGGSWREYDILNQVKGHPHCTCINVLSIGNPFNGNISPVAGKYRVDKLFFVMERESGNLAEYIVSDYYNFYSIKMMLVGLALGLEYFHGLNLIHRDIKPQNILWTYANNQYYAKFTDFGLSKPFTQQAKQTPGMVSTWYRAPEIALQEPYYTLNSDVWSLGCVFYEMVKRRPLLMVEDSNEKLLQAMTTLPLDIPAQIINSYNLRPVNHAADRRLAWRCILSLTPAQINNFNTSGPGSYDEFIDLLTHMCEFDMQKRYTSKQVVNHPFFHGYHAYIDNIHTKWPIKQTPTWHKLQFIECPERKWMTNYIIEIYKNRQNHQWYSHRILFQAIDLFDRQLLWLNTQRSRYTTQKSVESETHGKFMQKEDVKLRLLVCLYVSIKYFMTLHKAISFRDLAVKQFHTAYYMQQAETFEQILIENICQHQPYRPTVYEAVDYVGVRLDETGVGHLLNLILLRAENYNNLTVFELANNYVNVIRQDML